MEDNTNSRKNTIKTEKLISLIFVAILFTIFGFNLIYGKLLWSLIILIELPWSLLHVWEWEKYVLAGILFAISFGIIIYIIAHKKDC